MVIVSFGLQLCYYFFDFKTMESWESMNKEYIIYNPTLGISDIVYIDKERCQGEMGWLEEPYDMVSFNIGVLLSTGFVSFAQCHVISQTRWQTAYKVQYPKTQHPNQDTYRELLSLPLHGTLSLPQIKEAYRNMSKTTHPDLGGDHEHFIRITDARDVLIEIYS